MVLIDEMIIGYDEIICDDLGIRTMDHCGWAGLRDGFVVVIYNLVIGYHSYSGV